MLVFAARRAEIAEQAAEGLINGSDARRALEGIASTLGRYKAWRAPTSIALQALIDPEESLGVVDDAAKARGRAALVRQGGG